MSTRLVPIKLLGVESLKSYLADKISYVLLHLIAGRIK